MSIRISSAKARSSAKAFMLDVAAFARAVHGRFPENLILSHDLLEGGYARSRPGDRRRLDRRASRHLCHGGQPEAPLDQGRLAACRLVGPPRARARRQAEAEPALPARSGSSSTICAAAPAALVGMLVGVAVGPRTVVAVGVAGRGRTVRACAAVVGDRIRPQAEEWGWAVPRRADRQVGPASAVARAFLAFVCCPTMGFLPRRGSPLGSAHAVPRRGLMLWHLPSYGRPNARRGRRWGLLAEMWIGPALAVVLALVLGLVPCGRPTGRSPVRPTAMGGSPLAGWFISKPLRPVAAVEWGAAGVSLRGSRDARGAISPIFSSA